MGVKKLFSITLLLLSSNTFAESPWKEFAGKYHVDNAPILVPKNHWKREPIYI
jgi:hypothetical protein